LWYNLDTQKNIKPRVYTFCEVMEHIDLRKYLAVEERRTGRKRYDPETLLKVILFAFMEKGYVSVREIEKLCKTDIRFMWLLQEKTAPSFMTIDNFMNNYLLGNIEDIFTEINQYIFAKGSVDLEHLYIDGTKIVANANKYSWVWKKSCVKNRQKVFEKITALLCEINDIVVFQGVKFEFRTEYAIEYLEETARLFLKLTAIQVATIPKGRGHHKSKEQKLYEKLNEYIERLKKYASRSFCF